MRQLRKTQRVGDFRHVPLAVLEQYFGLLQNPFGNDLGGGFPGRILHGPVQVVDVDIQLRAKSEARSRLTRGWFSSMGNCRSNISMNSVEMRCEAFICCLLKFVEGCIFMAKCSSSNTRFRSTSYLWI